jgi:hypothetical protein
MKKNKVCRVKFMKSGAERCGGRMQLRGTLLLCNHGKRPV